MGALQIQNPLMLPKRHYQSLSSISFLTSATTLTFPVRITDFPITTTFSPSQIRMGGGPRTFPGGVSKWQWKRMQLKKSKQLLKARLCRERQIYEMRKRAELKAAVSELERPWEVVEKAPVLFSIKADEQLKALADRFQKPGGYDMWTERDGPQIFRTVDGFPSARFFPKGVVHSVRPYGKISDSPGSLRGYDGSSDEEEGEYKGSAGREKGSVYRGSRSRRLRFSNRNVDKKLIGESRKFDGESEIGSSIDRNNNNRNDGETGIENWYDGSSVEEGELDGFLRRENGSVSQGLRSRRSGYSIDNLDGRLIGESQDFNGESKNGYSSERKSDHQNGGDIGIGNWYDGSFVEEGEFDSSIERENGRINRGLRSGRSSFSNCSGDRRLIGESQDFDGGLEIGSSSGRINNHQNGEEIRIENWYDGSFIEEEEFDGSIGRDNVSVNWGSSRRPSFSNRNADRRLIGESRDFNVESEIEYSGEKNNNHQNSRGTRTENWGGKQRGRTKVSSYPTRSGSSKYREDSGIKGRRNLVGQQNGRVPSARNSVRRSGNNSYGGLRRDTGNQQRYSSNDLSKRDHIKDHQNDSYEFGEFDRSIGRDNVSVNWGSSGRPRFSNRNADRRLIGESRDFNGGSELEYSGERNNNHQNSRGTGTENWVGRQRGRTKVSSYPTRSGSSKYREDSGIKGRRNLVDQQNGRAVSARNSVRWSGNNLYGGLRRDTGNQQRYGSNDLSKRDHKKDNQNYSSKSDFFPRS